MSSQRQAPKTTNETLGEILAPELIHTQKTGVYRQLRELDDQDSTVAIINGRRTKIFASNDYLGLRRHPDLVAAAGDALGRYGTSAGASRLISGNCHLYGELEVKLAAFKNKEAALIFPTGYMANIGVLSSLAGPRDLVLMDRANHASLYDGCRLSGAKLRRFGHRDVERLQWLLEKNTDHRRRFVVTDGVFSADGDLAPLPQLAALAARHRCWLIVDDAHGTGVFGPQGRGTAAHFGVTAPVEIGTFSKALGGLGGFVAADRLTIDFLINKARPLIFTTGLPPATLAAASAAIDVILREPWRRERLLSSATRIRQKLAELGFDAMAGDSPIIPIMVGDEAAACRLADDCLEAGVFIPAVRHPTVPRNKARLRLTVSAAHTTADIDEMLAVISTIGQRHGLV